MTDQKEQEIEYKGRVSIWRLLGTLLSLALLVYLVSTQGWDEFWEVLKTFPIQYFFIAIALALLSRFFVTLRWFILLRSAGVPIRFGTCLRLVYMGLFASNFLPSTVGGDLVRLAAAITMRLDASVSAASLVVDRLVGMAGMACFLPFGLAYLARPAAGSAVHLPVVGAGLARVPGFDWVRRRMMKFIRGLLASATLWLRNPASLGLALLCTFGHQACTYLIIWVLLLGMQQSISFVTISGLWSLSYFFSLAPVSINGLGLQEVSIAYLYSNFGGVALHAGLALALLFRMLFFLVNLPGVIFLPDILRPLKKRAAGETSPK